MSTVTIRTCDKCGTDVPEGDELWTLGIIAKVSTTPETKIGHVFKSHSLPYVKEEHRRDYCVKCVTATGMTIHEPEIPEKKVPSLDELLQEIIEGAVQAAMEP